MTVLSVAVKALKPTQIAVGKILVKIKRKGLRREEGKPQELVNYILANPIKVVSGPMGRQYIIDHHHLGLALLKEGFKTAPVMVMGDLSALSLPDFWKEMTARNWVHAFDGKGHAKTTADIPAKLTDMEDDPYRSLAGCVRQQGGFTKTETPYMEFTWADYFRPLVSMKEIKSDFDKAVKKAKNLAAAKEAAKLPGYNAPKG